MSRAELVPLVSFATRFSKASLAERAQFQAALVVCDALSKAMDERNQATLNPAASNWPQRSAQLRQNIEKLLADQRAVEASATPGAWPLNVLFFSSDPEPTLNKTESAAVPYGRGNRCFSVCDAHRAPLDGARRCCVVADIMPAESSQRRDAS